MYVCLKNASDIRAFKKLTLLQKKTKMYFKKRHTTALGGWVHNQVVPCRDPSTLALLIARQSNATR